MNLIVVAGIGFGLIVVVLVAAYVVVNMDLFSYTATGSEALAPAGAPVGRALVVYSPGLSGAAREAAAKIARGLAERGYAVDLAGVRSAKALGGGYDVVVAGGPMYFGKVSASIEAYLKTLSLGADGRLGVFGTTGTSQYYESDLKSLTDQVASAAGGGSFRGRLAVKQISSGAGADADCAALVSEVLQ